MALPAVVSLLAMENRILVPQTDSAPTITHMFIRGLWRVSFR